MQIQPLLVKVNCGATILAGLNASNIAIYCAADKLLQGIAVLVPCKSTLCVHQIPAAHAG